MLNNYIEKYTKTVLNFIKRVTFDDPPKNLVGKPIFKKRFNNYQDINGFNGLMFL